MRHGVPQLPRAARARALSGQISPAPVERCAGCASAAFAQRQLSNQDAADLGAYFAALPKFQNRASGRSKFPLVLPRLRAHIRRAKPASKTGPSHSVVNIRPAPL